MGQNQKNTQEPDMNQLRKVRREKLAELQQNGRDPFQITKFNQTHHSLEVIIQGFFPAFLSQSRLHPGKQQKKELEEPALHRQRISPGALL